MTPVLLLDLCIALMNLLAQAPDYIYLDVHDYQ
uniref:Uncharacterized protein n=1 Tax=Setaria viridis TaxID=4556 RepID=A0A4U6TGC0_SETVI|nr:hypothetical protein SEVIR_8G086250v2 [Setaria viridis]